MDPDPKQETNAQAISSQDLFEIAAINSNTVIFDWDVAEDRLNWAGCTHDIFGRPDPKDLPGNTVNFIEDFVHPEDREMIREGFVRHFKHRAPFFFQFRLKNAAGNYRFVNVRGDAQWDSEGRAHRFIGAFSDIHDLKVMEEKLKRSNRDLQQFAATASHDLRQPLRAISGFMELLSLKYKEDLDDEAQKYIDMAVGAAHDMTELINDLLEYSMLEHKEINPKEANLEDLVKAVRNALDDKFKKHNATLEYESLPTIKCDPTKIQRVLRNLIQNGVKYNKTGAPVVKVSAVKKHENWEISVTDNGIGIPKDKFEQIFEMFQRLHTKSEFQGTGIGLSICKKLIEMHGGKIWIESEEGQGTTFFFTIPEYMDGT